MRKQSSKCRKSRFIRYQQIIMHTKVNDLNNENNNEKVAEDILTLAEAIIFKERRNFISGLI